MPNHYNLIIIGAGSGGLTAAPFAAHLGAKVALVDKRLPGGDCLYTGCVPSKALLKASKVAWEMRHAQRWGLPEVTLEVDLASVMTHVQQTIEAVYQYENPDILQKQGIDFILGEAHFLDPHTIQVGNQILTATKFLIATGASPGIPKIEGLQNVPYYTYETIFSARTLPKHFLVVGNGPIGIEMAQAFLYLGSQVTLFSPSDTAVAHLDQDLSKALAGIFEREGMHLRYNTRVQAVSSNGQEIHIHTEDGHVRGDALLIATGRNPSIDRLDLVRANVAVNDSGIVVNKHLQTSQSHIYACGDCTGSFQFTHYAGWQGFQAVRNMLLPGASDAILQTVPWTIFTEPEAASAGLSEAEARKKYGEIIQVTKRPLHHVDRAVTDRSTDGFIKVVHTRKGEILGVHILAATAGEIIHEYILAMSQKLKLDAIAKAIHVYPTYSIANQQLAAEHVVRKLLSGVSGKLIRRIIRLGK